MICLRSGYCCIHYDVVIVDNPELGLIESNLKAKPTGQECQHLQGEMFNRSCAIHHYPWYKDTPCFQYTQIEQSNSECRMGAYLKKKAGIK